jgi:hypothetical protein
MTIKQIKIIFQSSKLNLSKKILALIPYIQKNQIIIFSIIIKKLLIFPKIL